MNYYETKQEIKINNKFPKEHQIMSMKLLKQSDKDHLESFDNVNQLMMEKFML